MVLRDYDWLHTQVQTLNTSGILVIARMQVIMAKIQKKAEN